jgi:phosphoglycolate phosphatase-like HAD superfamily hydrolase
MTSKDDRSMTVRALVLDFDGVVLESNDVKTDAFVELYAQYGVEIVARVREHHLQNLGISRFKKFSWIAEHILKRPITESESVALGEQFSALALAKVLEAPMVSGAKASLAFLSERYPIYIASGTPQSELELIIARRGFAQWFHEVHGSPREKPAILRDIMARNGFSPAEVLFVGDGMSDYKAANEVGVEFLARDSVELQEEWRALRVRRVPDLVGLPEVVVSW